MTKMFNFFSEERKELNFCKKPCKKESKKKKKSVILLFSKKKKKIIKKMTSPNKESSKSFNTDELISNNDARNRKLMGAGILGATAAAYLVKGASFVNPGVWSMIIATSTTIFMTGELNV
jgi:hypothetical protein